MRTADDPIEADQASCPPTVAIVVFEDRRDSVLGRLLRPGFRHCFCLVQSPRGWLVCDPLRDRLRVELLDLYSAAELVGHYGASGRATLIGSVRSVGVPRRVPAPVTCVEVVKRILGRPAPLVVTPWQLCRFLLTSPAATPNFRAGAVNVLDSVLK